MTDALRGREEGAGVRGKERVSPSRLLHLSAIGGSEYEMNKSQQTVAETGESACHPQA